ncbi:phosphatase [Salmonella enterica subsp. enterica]|uniref:Phosphatase n=1 Tax=Salmonella enterica I TaxID=59201 RepID=A0A379W0R7_SALET|nr:phosphatase [Salmonella enterica subsp. enterica]
MKLHITVLASSLALAMPALAKDIPLSQAESIAKSVTPDSASVAFNDLEAQWLTQLRKALQGDTAALTRDAWLRCDRIPSRRIMPGYRLAVMIFILLRINRWGLPYFPPSIHCRKQY